MAIEIDGSSHDDIAKDNERQKRLEGLGVRFIRFADKTIKNNMNTVVLALTDVITELHGE